MGTWKERDVHLCRECEVVLWRRHPRCPACRAQHPALRMEITLPRTSARLERLAACVAISATGAMVLVDRGLHWLMVSL